MNAVEIEEALAELVAQPFDRAEFPFQFLAAFGNKDTTLRRLRKGDSNASDVPGGVLQRNNIHLVASAPGELAAAVRSLQHSPRNGSAKVKFLLATDGETVESEDRISGDTLSCSYTALHDHFGFFLPLAGITTVKEIKENPFDVKATGRLNKLYVELLRTNPEWAKDARRPDMNHFMARLVFCFFAEDTDIFPSSGLFSQTVEQMTQSDGANTDTVLETIFQAMNIESDKREGAKLPAWAKPFPYVNGGLFSGSVEVPKFSKLARAYLLRVGELRWQEVNPDIFGSMIQAVADDAERGTLGMHYTSRPNILRVLGPLFLDSLRAQLEAAGSNKVKLLNLRKRMAHIRVLDPACGSGNFLVIAYKEMRAIEAEVNWRRGEAELKSEIPLTNFRGIELRDFPAEIARLSLIIAEFQCDVLYRGQKEAVAAVLPLDAQNWIVCGNALRLDWLSVFPPTGTTVKLTSDDLFNTPLDQAEIDFDNEGGETYICGNPPYRGSKWQSAEQKADLARAWARHPELAKTTDLVTGWIARFLDYAEHVPNTVGAFVATNSICQGQQATEVWPAVFSRHCEIRFAHTSFQWANLATNNAGVTVVVVGIGANSSEPKRLFHEDSVKQCTAIGPYLVPDSLSYVEKAVEPLGPKATMLFGNMPRDGGHLFVDSDVVDRLSREDELAARFVKRFVGSEELINGKQRYCLWIEDGDVANATRSPFIADRLAMVAKNRQASPAESTRDFARRPHRFVQIAGAAAVSAIVVPRVSSENRPYLPVDLVGANVVVGDRNFAMYDAPLWNLALIASKLHVVWIATVCVRMRTDFSYSNTLGWNTFPVPNLTDHNIAALTRCAKDILLAREAHFPATIADLYDPKLMPDDLRHAHERNDEVLERIYIGRRFRNDTERLEKLFEMYSEMTANRAPAKKGRKAK